MKIELLSQLALRVSNIDASMDFYVNKLGLKHLFNFCRDDGTPWMYYLRIAPYQYLELIPVAQIGKRPDVSFHHIGLIVPDIREAATEALDKGMTLYIGPAEFGRRITSVNEITCGADGNYSFYLEDPDGNAVEIMQFSDNCKQKEYE